MPKIDLKILPTNLLNDYLKHIDKNLLSNIEKLEDSELSLNNFSFYTSVSAVYSSKIEGEEIELDSYIKHKKFGIEFLPDYTKKIDDLYDAYQFAKQHELNKENISSIHALLTKNILATTHQGKIRTGNMYVTTANGKIEYVAASPYEVNNEMEKWYADVDLLINTKLTLPEIFFFASLIHLIFLKIHPFNDGNGRTSRLIEKWFLAKKIGEKAWLIQSEKYYYENLSAYYINLRSLGIEYELLDYNNALPFLLMLPMSCV
jgi:Fic family protein